ncbi:MAG: hypothetical protein S4CHLAM102_15050 [Chlamydiia bacterium]|nr:hypothetical protein [Chlamydiia bacterium]
MGISIRGGSGTAHVDARRREELDGGTLESEAKRYKRSSGPIGVVPEEVLCRIFGFLSRSTLGFVYRVSRAWKWGVVEVMKGAISPVRVVPKEWGLGELEGELEANREKYRSYYLERAKRDGLEVVPRILPTDITRWVDWKWVEVNMCRESIPLWLAWAKRMMEEGFEEDVYGDFVRLADGADSCQLVQKFLVNNPKELIGHMGCLQATSYFLLLRSPFWRTMIASMLVEEGKKSLEWEVFEAWVKTLVGSDGLVDHTSEGIGSIYFAIVNRALEEGKIANAIEWFILISDLELGLRAEKEIIIAAMRLNICYDSLWRQIAGRAPNEEIVVLAKAYVYLEKPDQPDFQTFYHVLVSELALALAKEGEVDLSFWMIGCLNPKFHEEAQSYITKSVLLNLASSGYLRECQQMVLMLPLVLQRRVNFENLLHWLALEVVRLGKLDEAFALHNMTAKNEARQVERVALVKAAYQVAPSQKALEFAINLDQAFTEGDPLLDDDMHQDSAQAAAKAGNAVQFEQILSRIVDVSKKNDTRIAGAAALAEWGDFELADQIDAEGGLEPLTTRLYCYMARASFVAKEYDRLDKYMAGIEFDFFRYKQCLLIGMESYRVSDIAPLVRLASGLESLEKREEFLLTMYQHIAADRPPLAFELVERYGLKVDQETYLTDKAKYAVSIGDLEEAEKGLESILDISFRGQICGCIAVKYASMGRIRLALNWALKIESDEKRESTMQEVIEELRFGEGL